MCRKPVGDGANRVTTGRDGLFWLFKSFSLALGRAFLFSHVAMQRTSAPNIAGAPLPQRARGYWKARISAVGEGLERFLEAERAQLPLWFVVGFGAGIAAWFSLDSPTAWAAFLCLAASAGVFGFTLGSGRSGRALGWLGLAATLGCGLIWARSIAVAQPRLAWPAVVELRGIVLRSEPLVAKGVIRLTIAPADRTLPPQVRVSVDESAVPQGVALGAEVQIRARLAPPPPMALPGSYDFARDAWFRGIGAIGKGLGRVTVLKRSEPHGIDRARDGLRAHILANMPERPAGIAVALATGDQNAVNAEDAEAMRRSGLTHLLSVSGLHIAAAVAAAMLVTLKLLALSERLALRYNLVLVSAGAGAAAGVGYTLLTGAQVPTVRSCVAALLVLGGIALGRDAISLRLIAVGALLVLLFRPEALAGASFQMSFAAVTAIVALHSTAWARRLFERREEGFPWRLSRALLAMVATGLAVEIALAPLALYHFHRAGLYGVAANIIAIPLTTFVIMPLEAGALLLDVAGLGGVLWSLCAMSIGILLDLAHWVASARGAVALLPGIPAWAFALLVCGGLWICLWTSGVRRWGLIPMAVGAAGAAASSSPDLLITGDGKHVAVIRDGRPYLLRDRTGDYVQSLVSEAAGFEGELEFLANQPFSQCSRDSCVAEVSSNGRSMHLLATRSAQNIDWTVLTNACAAADIVVSDRRLPRGCSPRWLKLDRTKLQTTGGVALYLRDSPRIDTVSARVGAHPWAM
jgi:competence protein ComEC